MVRPGLAAAPPPAMRGPAGATAAEKNRASQSGRQAGLYLQKKSENLYADRANACQCPGSQFLLIEGVVWRLGMGARVYRAVRGAVGGVVPAIRFRWRLASDIHCDTF